MRLTELLDHLGRALGEDSIFLVKLVLDNDTHPSKV